MKNIFSCLMGLGVLALVVAGCKKYEDVSPIPVWETGVHGYAKYIAGSNQGFIFADDSEAKKMKLNWQWVSIDKLNTVTKAEFYISMTDDYFAQDGTKASARIGGDGIKFLTLEGGTLKGNRENIEFDMSQAAAYELFKNETFDYDEDGTPEKVFDDPERDATHRFLSGDAFRIRWVLTTADGRVFDSWAEDICTEFETYHTDGLANGGGKNCYIDWKVVCISELAGTYDYKQYDMVQGGAGAVAGEITGTVTWTPGEAVGQYNITDASFGHFGFVWGDDPALGSLKLLDACNVITLTGTDQYSDTYSYQIVSIVGPVMTLKWQNTYGDGGTVELTRPDGTTWPPLTGG